MMSSLRRWDPQTGRVSLWSGEDTDRGWLTRPSLYDQFGFGPWMDVYETDDRFVVEITLPGMDPDEIDVTVTGDTVTVQGELKEGQFDDGRQLVHRERHFGRFLRTVKLPESVAGAEATASYERGILTLAVPKAEEVRPRQIQVRAE